MIMLGRITDRPNARTCRMAAEQLTALAKPLMLMLMLMLTDADADTDAHDAHYARHPHIQL